MADRLLYLLARVPPALSLQWAMEVQLDIARVPLDPRIDTLREQLRFSGSPKRVAKPDDFVRGKAATLNRCSARGRLRRILPPFLRQPAALRTSAFWRSMPGAFALDW